MVIFKKIEDKDAQMYAEMQSGTEFMDWVIANQRALFVDDANGCTDCANPYKFETIDNHLLELWDSVKFVWNEATCNPSYYASLLATKRDLDKYKREGYYYAQLDKQGGGSMVVNVYRRGESSFLGVQSGAEYFVDVD